MTNRIAIYITAAVDITAAVATVVADLDPSQTGGVVAALAGVNALAIVFLKGWQQFENASYQHDLIEKQRVAALEVQLGQADLAKQVGGPRSNIKLPR